MSDNPAKLIALVYLKKKILNILCHALTFMCFVKKLCSNITFSQNVYFQIVAFGQRNLMIP